MIEDLKKRWPANLVSPLMFHELEDLEEALARAVAESQQGNVDDTNPPLS